MLPSLDGIRLKIKRVYQQVDALNSELIAFVNDKTPYAPALQLNRVTGAMITAHVYDFAIRIVVKEEPRPEWVLSLARSFTISVRHSIT